MRWIGVLLVLLGIGIERGGAQARPDSLWEIELGEIIVGSTEERASVTTVQRVPIADIERQDAVSVADVIRLIPAAHLQTNSRGETLAYLRNAGERQVALFFDGALLNIPWDNRVDLSLVPSGVVGSMIVAKGAASVLYGPNVMGGALNLIARSLDHPGFLTEGNAQVATHEARQINVTHLGRAGTWAYTAAFGYSASPGMPMPADYEVAFNQEPGDDLRTNTDLRLLNGLLRLERGWASGARMAVSLLHITGEKGVAAESHVPPDEARFWRYPAWRNSMLILNGSYPLGRTVLSATAWAGAFAQDIDQFQSGEYEAIDTRQEDRDFTVGTRLIASRRVGAGTLRLSFNGYTTRHDQLDFDPGLRVVAPTFTYRQHILSTGGEYLFRPGARWQVKVGGAWDAVFAPETGPHADAAFEDSDYSVLAGAVYQFTKQVSFKGSIGRKTRFATLRELFGAALGRFIPNPDLKPESAWLMEVGIERPGEVFSVEGEVFASFVSNTIDQIQQAGGQRQRINREGSRVLGIEMAGAWQPMRVLNVQGSLTAMSVSGMDENGEPTLKLTEKPEVLGRIAAFNTPGRGFTYFIESIYTGTAYSPGASDTFLRLDPSLVLNLKLGYRIFTTIGRPLFAELYARVDNATDAITLPQAGLPGPGREISIGLKVTV